MNVWEIHPALVHFPIALLLSAVALDVFAWWRPNDLLNRVATGLLIAGVGTGWLAANFGLLAFFTVPAHTDEAHALMFWHMGVAASSLVLFTGLAVARWVHRAEPVTGLERFVGLVAAAFLTITGALGGYIVYHGGAGVDPKLLAPDIREGHSHGGEKGKTPDKDMKEMDHGEKGKTPDKDMKEMNHGEKSKAPDKDMKEMDHGEKSKAPDKDMKEMDHGEKDGGGKPAPAAQRQHGQHQAKPKADETKEEENAGEAKEGKEKEGDAAAHQHGTARPKDPPLGPDFERNVQENRQRNMPKMDDHSKMGHGGDHKAQKQDGDKKPEGDKKQDGGDKKKDESGSKHQH